MRDILKYTLLPLFLFQACSDEIKKEKFDKIISIKKIGYGESLNVAIAGAIFLSEIFRVR